MRKLLFYFSILSISVLTVSFTPWDARAFGTKQWPIIKHGAPGKGVISFKSFEGSETKRVIFALAHEHGEYARFRKDDLHGEAVYDAAVGDDAALEYHYSLERMIRTFNLNKAKPIKFGAKFSVQNGYADISVLAFTRQGVHACVAYEYEWDGRPGDSDSNPGKVAFGYICKKQSHPLTKDQIAEFVGGLNISAMEYSGHALPVAGHSEIQAGALEVAKGSDGKTGNAEFPFDFGFPYTISRD